MAPQFVKPYVKTNKNDAADAEAICEAVARPNMRFVPVKNVEQQAVLSVHRVRQGFVHARTAMVNQIRGLLTEFGLVVPQGISHIDAKVPELIEHASNELPGNFRRLIERLLDHLKELDRQVGELEEQIKTAHRKNETSRKLEKIRGIGRSRPARSSRRLETPRSSRTDGNSPLGWAWCPLNRRAVARQPCSGSASAVTPTCVPCSSTARVPPSEPSRTKKTRAGILGCRSCRSC